MNAYQQLISTIALTMGTAWASGINLYATIGTLGILGATGNIVLPEQLHILQEPLVIGAACLMYMVEFFMDKTPGVDTGWDAIHSFIRIPAGVMLAAGAVGDVNPAVAIAAGILGGSVSATSHMLKAGSRVMINTSRNPSATGPPRFSRISRSSEDYTPPFIIPLFFLYFLFFLSCSPSGFCQNYGPGSKPSLPA